MITLSTEFPQTADLGLPVLGPRVRGESEAVRQARTLADFVGRTAAMSAAAKLRRAAGAIVARTPQAYPMARAFEQADVNGFDLRVPYRPGTVRLAVSALSAEVRGERTGIAALDEVSMIVGEDPEAGVGVVWSRRDGVWVPAFQGGDETRVRTVMHGAHEGLKADRQAPGTNGYTGGEASMPVYTLNGEQAPDLIARLAREALQI